MTSFAIAALQLDLAGADSRDRIERAGVNAARSDQTLKSFRDASRRYKCYADAKPCAALAAPAALGPLAMPTPALG